MGYSSTKTVQQLGKVLLSLATCAFGHMAYQAMKMNEQAHHAHSGHAPHEGEAVAGAKWFLLLCTVGLLAMVGGILSRGPVKPIELSTAPPVTGAVPEYRDFLNVGSSRTAAAGAFHAK